MDLRGLIELVESWQRQRESGREFTQRDLSKFADMMNVHAKKLISLLGRHDLPFYEALSELAHHSQTVVTKGAKLYVNKQHHTTN